MENSVEKSMRNKLKRLSNQVCDLQNDTFHYVVMAFRSDELARDYINQLRVFKKKFDCKKTDKSLRYFIYVSEPNDYERARGHRIHLHCLLVNYPREYEEILMLKKAWEDVGFINVKEVKLGNNQENISDYIDYLMMHKIKSLKKDKTYFISQKPNNQI